MAEPVWAKSPPSTVLFATDLSARCDRALDRSVILARAWGSHLVAVHAIEEMDRFYTAGLQQNLPSWQSPPDPPRSAEEQLRHDMRQGGHIAATVVERGEPVDVILRASDAHRGELIITGIARDETLGRFILGTTVDRLLRNSSVPVLVVKQRARSIYRCVAVAVDLSAASRRALQTATAFFPVARLSIFMHIARRWRRWRRIRAVIGANIAMWPDGNAKHSLTGVRSPRNSVGNSNWR